MQVPAQIVDERGALAHKPLLVLVKQPDFQLDSGKMGGREVLEAFLERAPGDRERVDRIGLAALANGRASLGHQVRREPRDRFAVIDKEPLERAGHVPAVLQHPRPLRAHVLVPSLDCEERTTGGQVLVEALPRFYSVTPAVLQRRRATPRNQVSPKQDDNGDWGQSDAVKDHPPHATSEQRAPSAFH
jgi:hypothetical protein